MGVNELIMKVKCPAKINLTLEILNKREDGFHNIQSIMQTIDLFDILTIQVEKSEKFEIKLSGTSDEIPYDNRNLVYKAVKLFFEEVKRKKEKVKSNGNAFNLLPFTFYSVAIHIEKNIPIAAGLAGGSTDAAGVLFGLNEIFDNVFSKNELHAICAKLGSDLNFCLEGGCQLATSRGEVLEKLPFQEFNLSLVKPKNLGISAKEAYTKFAALENKPNFNMTKKAIEVLKEGKNIADSLHNDLEAAIINDYKELQEIKNKYPKSIMSGSGSTFFVIGEDFKNFSEKFWIKTNLKSISAGVYKI